MTRYIVQRLLLSLILLWLIATCLFFFIHLLPGDPAGIILGSSEGSSPTPEQLATVRRQLGLDRPLLDQYLSYMGGILRGDLGVSLLTGRAVSFDLGLRLSRTVMLVIPAMILSSLLGIVLGVSSARVRGGGSDMLISAVGLVGHSLPAFVTGSLLVLLFSIWLGVLPSSGFIEIEEDPARFLRYITLPVVTLAIGRIASTMRMTRMAMVEQYLMDYVRTARAKGLREQAVVYRHVLRNALLPVVTVIGLQLGNMFAGAMIVEALFNWPGLNSLLLKAVGNRDYPLILGSVLVTSAIFVMINLITDLTYAFLDPRIRYE